MLTVLAANKQSGTSCNLTTTGVSKLIVFLCDSGSASDSAGLVWHNAGSNVQWAIGPAIPQAITIYTNYPASTTNTAFEVDGFNASSPIDLNSDEDPTNYDNELLVFISYPTVPAGSTSIGTTDNGTEYPCYRAIPATGTYVSAMTSGQGYATVRPSAAPSAQIAPVWVSSTPTSFVVDQHALPANSDYQILEVSADAGSTWAEFSGTHLFGTEGNQTVTGRTPATDYLARYHAYGSGGDTPGTASVTIETSVLPAPTRIAMRQLAITGTPDGTKYLKDDGSWTKPSGGGSLEVTDGTHDVTSVTKITASTGLAVAAGGTGEAILSATGGGGGSLDVKDVANATDYSDTTEIDFVGLVTNPSSGKVKYAPVWTSSSDPGTASEGMLRVVDATDAAGVTAHNDQYTGDGSTDSYTLAGAPVGDVLVFVGGVPQASSEYSVSGTTLTLGFIPVSGDLVILWYVA